MRNSTSMLLVSLALIYSSTGHAATVTINCTATVQSIGACSVSDNGESGVLIAYWVSSVDDFPGDADVAANSVDLRDAICARFGIPQVDCTAQRVDGAIRKLLVSIVQDYRRNKKLTAVVTPAAPVLDSQGNP